MPIFKAKKLILAGDPLQLPPTILSLDKDRKKDKTKAKNPSKLSNKSASTKAKATNSKTKSTPDLAEDRESAEDDGDTASEAEQDVEPARPAPDGKTPELRPPHTLETTLFDRLEKMYGSRIKRMLEVQYRYVS